MKNNKYTEYINDALKSMAEFSNGNTILGDPIITPNGTTIIAISKVTIGLLSGRGEYGEIKFFSAKDYPHSNAGGGVLSVKPCGFLIEKGKSIKFISCPQDMFDKAFEKAIEILDDKDEKI